MISWFARFKNRFEKLQKYHEKYVEKSDSKTIEKSSKNRWKMEPKSIKKPSKNEVQKMMQKWSQKGASPQPPADPLEGSLLRREQYRKRTNKQKNNKLLQNAHVGCRKVRCSARWSAKGAGAVQKREQSTNRIPTRLGRLRPGADFERVFWPCRGVGGR